LPLGLIWAFAAGGKIFVYQSGVLVTGYSYGYFKARDVFRVGLCVTVIESLVLLIIVPFIGRSWEFADRRQLFLVQRLRVK
jgi:hypothetical protein